ncbi:hypothetical protein G7Y89_g13323 [Cudoniella acicularis]|uniref:Cytochrome P450 n=1 Tax=Cudoniella acicularis TaxID=354080 RepID=A0A8H4R746_9HELO|nr:hypothetical protein G7Y89_g13323 [Cudoniella acicularis]
MPLANRLLHIALSAIFVLLVVRILRIGRRPAGYPPGPPTLPILGNIHLMPSSNAHLQFQKWAEKYGPVYSLILGTKTLVVLSSDTAVKDLLDKKSSIYSDRQDIWRTPSKDDTKLKQLFEGFDEFSVINQTGTAALIDFFPLLRKFPDWMIPTQAQARRMHEKEKNLYVGHWLIAKQSIQDGTAKPSFSADLIRLQEKEGFSDAQASYITGSLLEAGSDTTSSTLYGFVQAMLLFPEVQKKAQAEIDRVVGTERLPTMDDEPNLQYIRGVIKESLRWMPTTILGAVPHAVIQDDYYKGYLIPKDAGVLNNVYSIHHDPARFPNPRQFEPMRYKDDYQSLFDAANNPDVTKRDQFTFGAGRRICQGIHVVERSLFLGVSRLLWSFNFEPEVDENGFEILPDSNRLTQGFVCMPEPFKVKIVPRSKERVALIEKEWKEAQELLDPETKQWKEVPEGMVLPRL